MYPGHFVSTDGALAQLAAPQHLDSEYSYVCDLLLVAFYHYPLASVTFTTSESIIHYLYSMAQPQKPLHH